MLNKAKKYYKKLFRPKKKAEYSYNPYKPYHMANRCIFIHIPKTGGTTILKTLNNGRNAIRYHTPYMDFLKYNPVLFNEFYKFSFVRNPFDKIYSAYSYLCGGGDQDTDLPLSDEINRYKDFDDFVVNGLAEGLYRSHNLFRAQSYFVTAHDEKVMVDFVGKLEQFSQDWKIVADKLKLPQNPGFTNKSNRLNDYRKAYKKTKTIEIIDLLYKQDLKRWGYTFE